ncbi:hypothetical protein LPTSP4_23010 [Leptospira ryugenii]|uniref:Tetratricopeptide repeat protein n=1 Tax=Leptospira ryugenii TaxID=1917863 RepID=A0A2P2E1M9_9LEPT|nr:hypothetical protein [Leptospira ryugenii]GBF50774.1 hypothetical protein LPTSP4_23010 [Leptospira ryugenii]
MFRPLLSFCCFLFLITLPLHPESNEIFLPFPIEESQENTTETGNLDKDQNSNNSDLPSIQDDQSQISNPKADKPEAKTKEVLPKKKKAKAEKLDPTEGPYKRGKSRLTRNQKTQAESEFTTASNLEGSKVVPARTENANLFGLDGKDSEGSGQIEKVEDPDAKIKAQFELARSLDRMGKPEAEEKAYQEYLKIVTSFPVHSQITPRTHLAIAVLLFRKQEYRPALHHLVKVIKEFPKSREFPTAHYYAGRIYESAWNERDLERAKKYYDLYLLESTKQELSPGEDFRKDAKQRRDLISLPYEI